MSDGPPEDQAGVPTYRMSLEDAQVLTKMLWNFAFGYSKDGRAAAQALVRLMDWVEKHKS